MSVVDLETANMLFTEILNSGIPFGYQQANCHNISHYISILLKSKGFQSGKIWAFAPAVYTIGNLDLISFSDKKNISPTGKIEWGYHVAPLIFVRIGNKVQKMIIDPGLFPEKIVCYRTWLSKLRTRKLVYLIMDSDWYLFNSSLIPNSQIINEFDHFKPNIKLPDFFSDKLITDFFKYEDEAMQQHWVEKGLAINETAIAFYETEIQPLLLSRYKLELLNDYKRLIGNVFNFETIFRDSNWNYEMDNSFQFKYQIIIAKYREIYSLNLFKWQQTLSSLEAIIKKPSHF